MVSGAEPKKIGASLAFRSFCQETRRELRRCRRSRGDPHRYDQPVTAHRFDELTRSCHGAIDMQHHAAKPEDARVQAGISAVLERFPALRVVVPANFPADRRYDITVERMQAYSDRRTDRYWHLLNLPLALHAHGHSLVSDVRDLLGSLLSALDRFCNRFRHLRGTSSLLEPLWKDLWTDTPEIWSIASCVYLALNYDTAVPPVRVLGFEQPIGAGPRDADITLQLRGITHVDVEACHLPKFGSQTDDEIRVELETRALRKAQAKFRDLPTGQSGAVAVTVVIPAADIDRRFEKPIVPMRVEGMSNVMWLPLRLVGVRAPRQQFIIAGL